MIQLLTDQGTLPPGAKLFITDAKSMYTNIDTNHGTSQVEVYINLASSVKRFVPGGSVP